MRCCYCNYPDNKVLDSRFIDEINSIRRRRECLGCGRRYTTYEKIEALPVLVVKKNGERQPFKIDKIISGMIRACEKRPISISQIEMHAKEIEKKVTSGEFKEIESRKIGEFVMETLKQLDQVAYVRFASVYKQFEDVSTFQDFVKNLAGPENK